MPIAVDVTNLGEFALDTASTTVACTTGSAAAAGSTIIVTGTNLHDFLLTGVANSGTALTWTIDKQVDDSNTNVWIVSAYASAGLPTSTTITATFAGSTAGGRSITATSFTGITPTSPVDTSSGPTNFTGTTAWTTASTTIRAGSLLIAISPNFGGLFTSTVTAPSIEAHDLGQGTGFAQTTCYRIESSAGAYTIAGTWSSAAGSGSVGAVAYKASPQIPPTTTRVKFVYIRNDK